jgi:hypothetical protein
MKYNELLAQINEIKTATKKNSNTAEKVGSTMEGIASLIGTRIVTLDVSDAVNNIGSGKWELGEPYDISEFNFGMSAEEFMKLFEEGVLFCVKCDIDQEGMVVHSKFFSPSTWGYPATFGMFFLDLSPIKSYIAAGANTMQLFFQGSTNDLKGVITIDQF